MNEARERKRVGNMIARSITGDHALKHRLLNHLEAAGFKCTPRFFGIDEKGRELLSFLPGHVPNPAENFDDAQITAAAKLLRRFHDATASFHEVRQQGAEVICHNDWGPYNAVFQNGLPYALIDFDTIAPGLRVWDLGFSVVSWLQLGCVGYTPDEQLRRFLLFTRAYEMESCSPGQISVYAIARQTLLANWVESAGEVEQANAERGIASWIASEITQRLLLEGFPI